mgnify:CR=1 FL=1
MQRSLLRSLGIALLLSIALAPIKSNAIDSIVVFNEINNHPEENNHLYQVAEDIVHDKRPFPSVHFDRNALVKEGQAHGDGIYGMHKLHFPSNYCPEFLDRTRDSRLTDPLVDLIGPDLLGLSLIHI